MNKFFNRLGPGLLYAGAAVGVSHLVQSTRAGASYGLIMVAVVVLANVVKYPFFKAGPMFSASSGESLLESFHKKGVWAMALFYLLTLSSMFTVQAVVTLITASVLASIFGLSIALWKISAILLLICGALLLIGKYHLLDRVMRSVILLLTITTLVTLVASVAFHSEMIDLQSNFDFRKDVDLFFLIALVGWMPAPLDISLWHSEWTLADKKESGEIDMKRTSFDFKVGYWGTTLLAAAFVALGAIILKGGDESLSSSGSVFAGQIIGMYTDTLGKWSFVFIALAAFSCMFSTTLTVLDAYPRVMAKAIQLQLGRKKQYKSLYPFFLVLTVFGALVVLIYQLQNMKQLVDLATTISFLTAPVLASLIYAVVLKKNKHIFSRADHWLAWIGLIFLYLFSFYYLWLKFI